MQARVHLHGIAALIGTAVLMFSGVASAQIPKKPDQKCINNINKGALKVAKAQASANNACVKDYGKGKNNSADTCVVSNPKGKVGKAISKIKVGDCPGVPPALPGLDIDSASIGATMVAKDLDLLHDIFGSDAIDGVLVLAANDKPGSKCQAAVIKAAGKCQDAKLKEFGRCKKNGMKDGSITDAQSLQDNCLGVGGGTIPDPKGKISKKCGGDFDLAKKCSVGNVDDLIPGCAPGVSAACIDQKIECRVCLALNAIDGLARDCDLFDNGVEDGSCLLSVSRFSADLDGESAEVSDESMMEVVDVSGDISLEAASGSLQGLSMVVAPAASLVRGDTGLMTVKLDPNNPPIGDLTAGVLSITTGVLVNSNEVDDLQGFSEFDSFCVGGPFSGGPCTEDSDCPGGTCQRAGSASKYESCTADISGTEVVVGVEIVATVTLTCTGDDVGFTSLVIINISFFFEIIPAPPCPEERKCPKKELCVQPIVITDANGNDPTSCPDFQASIDIWEKCCINLDVKEATKIQNSDLKTIDTNSKGSTFTAEEKGLTGIGTDDGGAGGCIEVYCIEQFSDPNNAPDPNNPTSKDFNGGGWTMSGGSNKAKVVVVNSTSSPRLPAHELGHVLGLDHPDPHPDPNTQGYDPNDPRTGTIVQPTGQHDEADPNNPASQTVKLGMCKEAHKSPAAHIEKPKKECCKEPDPD